MSQGILQAVTAASTPLTAASSTTNLAEKSFEDVKNYIALGCLHFDRTFAITHGSMYETDWIELLHSNLSDEIKLILGNEASRLLDARWIRLFNHQPTSNTERKYSLVRVYLLPEDWGRRFIDRNSKSLKAALRLLLQHVDISPNAWNGGYDDIEARHFDPWASEQNFSLYYLFNKLPSPAPTPEIIKNRYTRAAIHDLLKSAAFSKWEEFGEQPLTGLKTRLYPYQARSASVMIQREAAPQLQLDPRLEIRMSPNGEQFYFGARDGSFLQEPRYYETNRGGILAETMGLGKTVICLAVILATKGHFPQIPAAYQPTPPLRSSVGRLSDMAASILGRRSIPAKIFLEQSEANGDNDFTCMKDALERNIPFYEVPPDPPRMNRATRIPPPRQLVICHGTIIVVPRNLLHQWQSEIKKHVLKGGLKILVVDSIPKRGNKARVTSQDTDTVEFSSKLPAPTELMKFDVVLFTRNRFELEIQDGSDDQGRRAAGGVTRACNCPYIGATRIPNCNCVDSERIYESPLKKLHWLRIIIDEGHNFSSSASNAVLVAKQIQAERRWVVSGTPAKNLVGVEVEMSTLDTEQADPTFLRESAIEQRKHFILDQETSKATKALGSLASNFLKVRPWCDSDTEGKLDWEEYIYRHEHQYRKTFSGFSSCFLRTLEGLVVKTRPEDVDKDIVLPPMRHRVVYIKPCWFDRMTANLFIQVLRANAITSERTDVDYLFHKNSLKARHSLIRNLRQSNFTWTGFRLADVISTLETSNKYLLKDDKKCSLEDAQSLLESSQVVSHLVTSEGWISLSKAHEVGMAIEGWPADSEESFAFAYPTKPTMVGITQVLDGQMHVDSNIVSRNPTDGLNLVGEAAKARVIAMAEAEDDTDETKDKAHTDPQMTKTGVPSSCVGAQQPLTTRRASAATSKSSPQKSEKTETVTVSQDFATPASPVRPKKRKLTLTDEIAELATNSPLRSTRVIGTTSAKLTYLLDKVIQHQAHEKIIIFYDGDNAAFYIAQCLEMLYINHRIYARTLDNTRRSEYVKLFNEDPDVRVLLIDVACGALGLNLNAASVVLIVNPINRPGIEAQAIKRAHRIGQMREVLVETLVLENTIEHAIFDHAKKMSRSQHLKAKELEDDEGIIQIIQNAHILPIEPEEGKGMAGFALLKTPQQIFGRPNRHKYHRYGFTDAKTSEKRKTKTTNFKSSKKMKAKNDRSVVAANPFGEGNSSLNLPLLGRMPEEDLQADHGGAQTLIPSIFGMG
ncbi:SNF2 family N-terminal domain-containing protein [Pyrenochaeta sp. MPI-SDFR-AT-0127]|nr:SNF2 family N-terminal domain-containing protein [Pyrenochaeta sp. MPI-SDFR-AT-0127]